MAVAMAVRTTGSASAGFPVPIVLPETVRAPALTSTPVHRVPGDW